MITIETPGFIQNISSRILAHNMVCVPPDFGPPAPGLTSVFNLTLYSYVFTFTVFTLKPIIT